MRLALVRRFLPLALLAVVPRLADAQGASFRVEEATIAQIHAAMRARRLTCRGLVDAYLRRIERYDKTGPAINAIVVVNPAARIVADSLDRRYASGGPVGPLHCVPMIVKDNYDTKDLPTTAGSLSMKGFVPSTDATTVARLRAAGAIVLAKSNMAEFAFSPYETVSSILPGYTKNPYALDRVTAGSSGGTAAAVAASFGAAGLGTDTGNSIRGPSAHDALVGIRSTMGLTTRAGVVPLNLSADIAGPMARTVADAVAVFQVVVGEDAADPVTAASGAHPIPDYARSLRREGLRGARIGVLKQAYDAPTADAEVLSVFAKALEDMRRQGATIVDPVVVDSLDEMRRAAFANGGCNPFKHDLEAYLAAHPTAPVHTVAEIIKSRRFHPSIEARLQAAEASNDVPDESPGCRRVEQFRSQLRAALLRVMDEQHLDALVYPTWSNVPRLIGDLNTPAGDNSQLFSPYTGFPAMTVPMGYTRGGRLPAGISLLGRPWGEAKLIELGYAYEQATHHRKAPASTP